jgi:hypothetical protein
VSALAVVPTVTEPTPLLVSLRASYARVRQLGDLDLVGTGEGEQAVPTLDASPVESVPLDLRDMIAADPGRDDQGPPAEVVPGEPIGTGGDESSWAPRDLAPVLGGVSTVEAPTILRRDDGEAMLYPGRNHSIAGESESCKSLIAQHAVAEQLRAGHDVGVIDFETDEDEWVARLLALGVDGDLIGAHLHYVRPDEPIDARGWSAIAPVLACHPTLIIWDGVTEAMTLHGLNPYDNSDVARWQQIPKRATRETGAAGLELDHVAKDKDTRGRWSIGAQHKMAGVYVLYIVEVVEPFGRGRSGEVKVRVEKDRPGFIRRYAQGKDVATFRFVSDGEDAIEVAVEPPSSSAAASVSGAEPEFRPTTLMERVSEALEVEPGLSKTRLRDAVSGKSSRAKDTAIRLLVAEGYVRTEPEGDPHPGRPQFHFNVRFYRAAEDEKGASGA